MSLFLFSQGWENWNTKWRSAGCKQSIVKTSTYLVIYLRGEGGLFLNSLMLDAFSSYELKLGNYWKTHGIWANLRCTFCIPFWTFTTFIHFAWDRYTLFVHFELFFLHPGWKEGGENSASMSNNKQETKHLYAEHWTWCWKATGMNYVFFAGTCISNVHAVKYYW